MALQGTQTWKGITLTDAYCMVSQISSESRSDTDITVVTPATYDDDGILLTDAVTTSAWVKTISLSYNIQVFKDKATKDANPNEYLFSINKWMVPSVAATAKNYVKQVYVHAALQDEFADHTSV
jgi:hypothetical protein